MQHLIRILLRSPLAQYVRTLVNVLEARLAFGALMILLASAPGCESSEKGLKASKTWVDMDTIAAGIETNTLGSVDGYEQLILRLHELRALDGKVVDFLSDGWGRPYVLAMNRSVPGRTFFIVASAGPDGRFGTRDDLFRCAIESRHAVSQPEED